VSEERDWEWSQYWIWFTAFALGGVALSWVLDPIRGFQLGSDVGRAFVCVLASQLVAVHLQDKRFHGPNFRASFVRLSDWLIVLALRSLIHAVGYFVAAFLVLYFFAGGGLEPRR
jgi:uncharacterized membrane protein YhaH (DUF805 family)